MNNPDGTKTVAYHGDDIHDFAWTASPHYKIVDDTFNGSMGPVKVRVMLQPGHMFLADRHKNIVQETMDHFDRWYGPYPYKTLTVVDHRTRVAGLGHGVPDVHHRRRKLV